MVARIVLPAAVLETHIVVVAHRVAVVHTVAAEVAGILQVAAQRALGQVAILHRRPRVVKRAAYRWYEVEGVWPKSKWDVLESKGKKDQ